MKQVLRCVAVALVMQSAAGAAAADLALKCSFPKSKLGQWISPVVFIGHKPGAKTAVVSDPIILHAFGKPIEARVSADNAKRLTVKWMVEGLKDSNNKYVPRFNYRATYLKASRQVMLYAQPSGYDNDFGARGTCVKVKQ